MSAGPERFQVQRRFRHDLRVDALRRHRGWLVAALLPVVAAFSGAAGSAGEAWAQDTAPAGSPVGAAAPVVGNVGVAGSADIAAQNPSDTTSAIANLSKALEATGLSNDRRAALLNDRAVAYMRSGQVRLAIDDYNKAAQLFPEYAAVYNNRGNLLLSLGLIREAIKDFDRAIVLAPGYAAAYNNRAAALSKNGQMADAIRDYTKAIALMPQSPAPLSGRGRAHLQLLRPHAAIRDFTRAVNTDTRFVAGYRNRAEAKLQVEHYDEAIEDLSRAAAFDGSNAEIFMVRGQAYLAIRNVASALKDFTAAIELNPKLGPAFEGRGLAHGLAEAYEEAYADLNTAIEIEPRSAVAFAYRAFVYKQNAQLDVAQKDLETAMKLGPNTPEVLWALAEFKEAEGDQPAAIGYLKKALVARPAYKDAADSLARLGGLGATAEDKVLKGAGIDLWRVVERGGRFLALNETMPRVSVPLEMLGEGKPRLISWEVKEAPFTGVGVLRFFGGDTGGKGAAEAIELAALIDIDEGRVIAIEPDKQGSKSAQWTWEPGRVVVASIDGITDEYPLRTAPATAAGPAGLPRRYSATPRDGAKSAGAKWAPWDQPLAGGQSAAKSQRSTVKKKPKTLFDLLFN